MTTSVGQRLALDVLGDDRAAACSVWSDLLQQRQQVRDGGDLAAGDQDVGVLEDGLHALGVGHEVRRDVALVELQALGELELRGHGVEHSSTVMTPSLPTLSIASAISSPIVASCAEMVATCAISLLVVDRRGALSSSASLTASAAASMPRLRPIGLAPAATLRRPSRTIAWASTVAVVVPSPATSLVLVATSLASWAPRFSYGSVELDLLGDGHAVVGDRRGAELLVEDDVAAARAEGDLDRVGEGVDAALERAPGVVGEAQDLRHVSSPLVSAATAPAARASRPGAVACVSPAEVTSR